MAAVTYWVCSCGCKVKVLYATNDLTILRCPNSPCKKMQKVNGKVSKLWSLADNQYWLEHDVSSLVVPSPFG